MTARPGPAATGAPPAVPRIPRLSYRFANLESSQRCAHRRIASKKTRGHLPTQYGRNDGQRPHGRFPQQALPGPAARAQRSAFTKPDTGLMPERISIPNNRLTFRARVPKAVAR